MRTSSRPAPAGRLVAPALVERDGDLSRLLAAVAQAPAVVTVAGEAGVGKSRLLAAAIGHPVLVGQTVLIGHCHPMQVPLPFGPVMQALAGARPMLPARPALGAVAGTLHALLPELADRLPAPLPSTGDPEIDRHRLFRGVRELLACLGPATLVLEDLHWVDRGTLDLLSFLSRELPPALRLVLTYRQEDLPSWCTLPATGTRLPGKVAQVALELAPLSVNGVRLQAAAILDGAEVSRASAERLHEWTAGLPFAVEEVLRLLHERGETLADCTVAGAGVHVPSALRDSLRERLDGLRPPTRCVVDAAAVLGESSSEPQLVAMAGLSAARGAEALADAVRRALLLPDESQRYAFRHALARQAAYEALPLPQRRRLHATASHLLRDLDPPPLARLAHHCRLAGQARDWRRFAEAAADQAVELGDHSTAVRLLDQVLSVSTMPKATRARLTLKLGRAGLSGMTGLDVAPRLRHALAEDGLATAVRGEVRLMLGFQLLNGSCDKRAGRAEIELAVDELRARPALAARALSIMAYPNQTDEHVRTHLALLERTTALLPRITDATERIAVQINCAMVLLNVGDPAAWELIEGLPAEPDRSVQLAQLLRGMINFSAAAALLGRLDRADRFLAGAQELQRRSACDLADAWMTITRIRLDWLRGQWSDLDRLIRRQRGRSQSNLVMEAQLVAGLLALARGNLAEAEHDLRSILDLDGPELCGSEPANACAGLVRLLASRGELHLAIPVIDRLVEVAVTKGVWSWSTPLVPAAVGVYAMTGREADGRALLDEFTGWLANRDSPMAVAAQAEASARLAEGTNQWRAADERFAEAAQSYRALGAPYLAAQATEAAGRCRYATAGDGSAQVAAALAEFERLGASWDAARCRRELRAHGIAVTHRRGRRGYGPQLSPREREVVRLAASGSTNRQIATALCLSERTVEEHVARALRKLGLRSRRQLRSHPV